MQQAISGLTKPESFVRRQREDTFWGQVCQRSSGFKDQPGDLVEVTGYDIGDNNLLRIKMPSVGDVLQCRNP